MSPYTDHPRLDLWFETAQHSLLDSFIRYNSKYRYYLLGQKRAFVLLIRFDPLSEKKLLRPTFMPEQIARTVFGTSPRLGHGDVHHRVRCGVQPRESTRFWLANCTGWDLILFNNFLRQQNS